MHKNVHVALFGGALIKTAVGSQEESIAGNQFCMRLVVWGVFVSGIGGWFPHEYDRLSVVFILSEIRCWVRMFNLGDSLCCGVRFFLFTITKIRISTQLNNGSHFHASIEICMFELIFNTFGHLNSDFFEAWWWLGGVVCLFEDILKWLFVLIFWATLLAHHDTRSNLRAAVYQSLHLVLMC